MDFYTLFVLTKRAQKYIKFVGFLSAVHVKVYIVTQEAESSMHADKNMPSQHPGSLGYKDTNAILFTPPKQGGHSYDSIFWLR